MPLHGLDPDVAEPGVHDPVLVAEHVGEERVVLGEDLVEYSDDLTFVVRAAVLERFAETSQITKRQNILVGQPGLGEVPEANGVCYQETVDRVCFRASYGKVPETVGLNRVDDMEYKALPVEEGIQGNPVMAGSFHTDAQLLAWSDLLLKEGRQREESLLIVGEPQGLPSLLPFPVDDSGFVVVFPDVDTKIQHNAHSV